MEKIDRIGDWKSFSEYMADLYLREPEAKYGGKDKAPDLMTYTDRRICIWNILKYVLRQWNGQGKKKDLEKIAHYAQIAWVMEYGKNPKIKDVEEI